LLRFAFALGSLLRLAGGDLLLLLRGGGLFFLDGELELGGFVILIGNGDGSVLLEFVASIGMPKTYLWQRFVSVCSHPGPDTPAALPKSPCYGMACSWHVAARWQPWKAGVRIDLPALRKRGKPEREDQMCGGSDHVGTSEQYREQTG
jgi:hypothetical protein